MPWGRCAPCNHRGRHSHSHNHAFAGLQHCSDRWGQSDLRNRALSLSCPESPFLGLEVESPISLRLFTSLVPRSAMPILSFTFPNLIPLTKAIRNSTHSVKLPQTRLDSPLPAEIIPPFCVCTELQSLAIDRESPDGLLPHSSLGSCFPRLSSDTFV